MKIDVPHVAKLANLPLDEKETEKFETQLSAILDYVKKLDEVNVTDVKPTSQTTGLENVTDEDKARESLPQDAVLSQTAAAHNNQFQVKGIFDND